MERVTFVNYLRSVAVALSLLFLSPAIAAEKFDSRTWKRVKTYDMVGLQQLDTFAPGKLLGVKFNYRNADVRELHPHWYLGSIWRVVRDAEKAQFMHINVMIREDDLAAFQAITTDFHSQRKYVVYGEALHYRDSTFPFLRLIGTKVKRGRRSDVTVSW